MCHLAHDIWRFGPTRLNWCFGYEAKNQPLKRGCKRSNFRNAAKSTCEFWCESSDFHLQLEQAERRPAVIAGAIRQSGPIDAHPDWGKRLAFMAQYASAQVEPLIFSFVTSVSVYGQQMRVCTYAFAQPEGSPSPVFCKVTELVEMQGLLYAWTTAYPASVITYDTMGVLHISAEDLAHPAAEPNILMVVDTSFAPLWHFKQRDNSMTFVSKW